MTNIERAIYNSALENKEKKIQLCNHVLVSEHHINILGNEPISMDEAHKKMVEYYDKKIKYQNTRLENIGTELETLEHPRDETKINDLTDKKNTIELELNDNIRKKLIFDELEENLNKEEGCPVCYEELTNLYKAATPCGHFICGDCIQQICNHSNRLDCPMCRTPLDKTQLQIISPETMDLTNRLGTKMTRLIEYSKDIISLDADNRIIIFSQWDSMLKLISKNLKNNDVNHLTLNGSYNTINSKLRKFKLDSSIRILLLSSDKAASGLNLTEANHIILMDTLNNDPDTSKIIESQAIGRAVRIGQTKNVQVKRFIMANTIEEEFYNKYISIN
jgi:DNA repair protein RAD5